MKFDVQFGPNEIRLALSESLALPEGRLLRRESPPVPAGVDILQQIEALARQFLEQSVMDRGGSL